MFTLLLAKLSFVIPSFFGVVDCSARPGLNSFFGIPHWWKYLPMKPDGSGGCEPGDIKSLNDIWGIVLAIIDILVRVAGIAIVIFIIYAGISYILSQGNPEKTTAARKRITNSLIGMAIIITASILVAFIGNTIGK